MGEVFTNKMGEEEEDGMSVSVKFSCDGCDKISNGTGNLKREFQSITGRGYGFGSWKIDGAQDVAPDGWVSFDPYTGCCYCPDCWDGIENPSDA